jgi:hypothetical protein
MRYFLKTAALLVLPFALMGQTTTTANFGPTIKSIRKTVEYDQIKGNCFSDTKWKPAQVILTNGTTATLAKARLNFYSNEIEFVDEEGEGHTVINKFVKGVAITDSLKSNEFRKFKKFYGQILTGGPSMLIKRTEANLLQQPYDPMRGTKEYYFEVSDHYFIALHDGQSLWPVSSAKAGALFRSAGLTARWTEAAQKKDEPEMIALLKSISKP